ncbi:Protein strawberry notch homolog 1,Protein strawberry notch homolog 2,Protein strawberry notch [Acanthosepion pharaonis]|uniref:Protein strawberry notch homolog 1,Protein strawberry notch homolog 2,Protein strawberry notch n=1 Tax=Acanthosepion pharaonis TaxID=158019 RepID=A0A812EYT3_ACAPH|nr:Protein strawberry notch homolog 1,Protein strawberry notch homolog 2,Protein strawberry notch [Sepia pharaonis]
MATDAPPMPQDLLSAALSESGIGDLASFDETNDSFLTNETFTDSQPTAITSSTTANGFISVTPNNVYTPVATQPSVTVQHQQQQPKVIASNQIRPRVVLQPTNHSLSNTNSPVIRVVKSSGGSSQLLHITGPNNSYLQNAGLGQPGSKIISLTPKNVGSQSGLPTSFAGQKIYISTTSSTGRSSPLLTEVNAGKSLQLLSQLGLSGSNIKVNTITSGKLKPTVVPNIVKNVSQTTLAGNSPQAPGISIPHRVHHHHIPEDEEEVEEEIEELGQAETYSEYMPTKLRIGEKHPDAVVESSSLSSVEPPNVRYTLNLPEGTIDSGQLSALQLESITYACQRHDTIMPSGERAGFLIGDGAGVGKGRTVAGIIFENYLQGRKRALWFSVSNDLKVDAERDLKDIGAGKIEVHALNKHLSLSLSLSLSIHSSTSLSPLNPLQHLSLSNPIHSSTSLSLSLNPLQHLSLSIHSSTSLSQSTPAPLSLNPLQHLSLSIHSSTSLSLSLFYFPSSCNTNDIIKPTKTGQTVLELQNKLPKARVIYASATGASEPKNMAYMTRLGLWGQGTPFKEFSDFIQAVERRGVGAMELVAMDMKLRGMYIARQLSFGGTSFRIEEINLPPNFVETYNKSVKVWVRARELFQNAADLIGAEQRMKKSMWGQFWSAHQRFFKYLCISAKVAHCVKLTREAVKNGKCVVIGLQSTGEARTLEQLEEHGGELNDFVSTAKGVFQTLVEKHFPAPDRRKTLDFLNLGNDNFSNEDSSWNSGAKRKKGNFQDGNAKRIKCEKSDSTSDSDSSDSSLSPSESSDSDSDDFNPFGSGSDSDDDPWLKKSKARSKIKEKKKKKKKKKDSDKDVDAQFDKALAAIGLLKKNNSLASADNDSFSNTSMDSIDQAIAMKRELLESIEKLSDILPPNTLDHLIDELGGPENVAEMTGRKGRVVSNEDGGVSYESRSELDVPLEILNLTEKQRFMDGEKNIAIISEAASSGISLQADRRARNQKRRVHITLELPWSADRAIQQFGRTHRSNQVSAPEYIFLISELAGERRFASTVAKRLESLGALTHGDRRATETRDLSRFNFDNKYGRAALESVMKSVLRYETPLVSPPTEYSGDFFEDIKTSLIGVGLISLDERVGTPYLEKEYNNISKFLNRILGMPVEQQNALFKYFLETLTAIILDAKRNGRWDMGIMDLGSGGESVKKLETKIFVGNTDLNKARTELHTVSVERGLSWNQAIDIWKDCKGQDDGFYLSAQMRNGKKTAVLAVHPPTMKKKERHFHVYRPNTGLQPRSESPAELKKKFHKGRVLCKDNFSVKGSTLRTTNNWGGVN